MWLTALQIGELVDTAQRVSFITRCYCISLAHVAGGRSHGNSIVHRVRADLAMGPLRTDGSGSESGSDYFWRSSLSVSYFAS